MKRKSDHTRKQSHCKRFDIDVSPIVENFLHTFGTIKSIYVGMKSTSNKTNKLWLIWQ